MIWGQGGQDPRGLERARTALAASFSSSQVQTNGLAPSRLMSSGSEGLEEISGRPLPLPDLRAHPSHVAGPDREVA